MCKTLLGMAGAAALVFSIGARADDGDTAKRDALRDESGRGATVMIHGERARSEDPISSQADSAMKPCDATGAGSASGEPSARDEERDASRAEFLRNVWTTP
jgi:hypothetical protein